MPRRSLRHYLAATLLSAVVLSSIALASDTPKEHTPPADAAAVPLFFPRLTPYRAAGGAPARFDASLYLRYREYRAALGLLLAWGVLALKAALSGLK